MTHIPIDDEREPRPTGLNPMTEDEAHEQKWVEEPWAVKDCDCSPECLLSHSETIHQKDQKTEELVEGWNDQAKGNVSKATISSPEHPCMGNCARCMKLIIEKPKKTGEQGNVSFAPDDFCPKCHYNRNNHGVNWCQRDGCGKPKETEERCKECTKWQSRAQLSEEREAKQAHALTKAQEAFERIASGKYTDWNETIRIAQEALASFPSTK